MRSEDHVETEEIKKNLIQLDEDMTNLTKKLKRFKLHSFLLQFILLGAGIVTWFVWDKRIAVFLMIMGMPFSEEWYQLYKHLRYGAKENLQEG